MPSLEEFGSSPNLPTDILLHVYGAESGVSASTWTPCAVGMLSVQAAALYAQQLKFCGTPSPARIIIAGDHRDERGGITIGDIYATAMNKEMWRSGIGDYTIISEGSETNKVGAHNTAGEINYMLKKIGTGRGRAIAICAGPHKPYIDYLTGIIGVEHITPVSAEGIFERYQPHYLLWLYRRSLNWILTQPDESHTSIDRYLVKMFELQRSIDRRMRMLELGDSISGGQFGEFATKAISEISKKLPRAKRAILEKTTQ